MRKNNKYYLRKTHRWLGVIIGVQFLLWTISGLYFSWTDIDEIHGDHLKKSELAHQSVRLSDIRPNQKFDVLVEKLELRFIDGRSYLWINDSVLLDSESGTLKPGINQNEAESIATHYISDEFYVIGSELLTETGPHHEYRGRPLPVWAVSFEGPQKMIAYVSQRDGKFQRVRHESWRWFDFLWMFHTMDYQGRDDFNNFLLRAFSLFGLLTIFSGFTLFAITTKWKR